MNLEWKKCAVLFWREMLEFRAVRRLAILALFGGLQGVVMAGARAHGRMEDTMLVFMLGGIAAIFISFDLISREREHHTLDLLLTQGTSRASIFFAKWLSVIVGCGVMSALFTLGTLIGTLLSAWPLGWRDLLVEWLVVSWLLGCYGVIALACSVGFRRGKWALTASAVIWVILRPMVVALILIDPLQRALNWGKTEVWQVVTLLPEFAMRMVLDPVRGSPNDVSLSPTAPAIALAGWLLLFSLLAAIVFFRQDEPTNG